MDEAYTKEKPSTEPVEHRENGYASSDTTPRHGIEAGVLHPTSVNEKAVMRKVDRRLLLILGALYSVALIDRTNLSSARVAGMAAELRLTLGERYSIVTVVFFVPYIVFELPSNILLRYVGARNLLSAITIAWGAVMVGMAFVTEWHQLVALRVLLGFFESGFFPGCVFLISTWYTRWETQKRLAFFYLISMAVSGFSQIIAYGFSRMPRTSSLYTWRWIFFMFGILTVALGILAVFLIVDFPDKNKFLSPAETAFVIERVNVDRGDGIPDKLTGAKAMKHLADWRTWCFALLFMSATLPSYAFSYFLPVILSGAGYSTLLSLMLAAPPYIAAAFYTFAIAYASDKTRQRGLFVCINALVCIAGCLIIGYATTNRGVRLFGSFLAIMGAQCNVPSVLAYSTNNTITHSKKAVASAMVIGGGGVGGIFASLIFRQKDYPRYLPGLWAAIAAQFATLLVVGILTLSFRRTNKKLDAGEGEAIQGVEGFRYSI